MTFSDYAYVSIEGQVTERRQNKRRGDGHQEVFEKKMSGGRYAREERAKNLIAGLLLIIGLGVLAMPAAATVIKFDDVMEGALKVTVDDKPCPPEGPTHCFIAATGETASFFSAETAGFTLPPMASRTSSVLILEPAGTERGGERQFAISDFLSVRLGGSIERGVNITIDFSSDPDTVATSDGSPEITEDGKFQNITPLLLRTAGGNFPANTFPADFQIQVRSDIPAPEPSSLLLIVGGLIALAVVGRLRRPRPSCAPQPPGM